MGLVFDIFNIFFIIASCLTRLSAGHIYKNHNKTSAFLYNLILTSETLTLLSQMSMHITKLVNKYMAYSFIYV